MFKSNVLEVGAVIFGTVNTLSSCTNYQKGIAGLDTK